MQPLAKTFSSSQKLTAATIGGGGGSGAAGVGCAAAERHAQNASCDSNQKRADKKICGKREDQARIAHPAQIEDGDHDQNADAEANRVRQQRRHRRHQRAHARRNPHGGREDVVGEQRRRGQQPGLRAKVETRHGIRAAAGGIRGDGLPIREVDDHEQRDDCHADWHNVPHAEQAERNQKAERRFRAVRGGTEPVEAKDRDALQWTDLLGAFITRCDRLADN